MASFFAPSDIFEPPSLFYLFLLSPPKLLLRFLYRSALFLRSPSSVNTHTSIRVVSISDTHCEIPVHVPDGDLLIHAGDLTKAGTPAEIQAQIDWLNSLPHTKKVAIAGNHDTYLDPRSRSTVDPSDREKALRWGDVHYLQHSSVVLDFPSRKNRKLRVHGAPQIPACGGPEFAFQYPRGSDGWSNTVPADTDILVTHGPPKYHLDLPVGLGCEFLLKEAWRIQAPLHIFGHVHAGRGREVAYWDAAQHAYEQGCTRRDGFFRSTLDIMLWFYIAKVAWHGLSSLIWQKVWGGEERASSWLINTSVMYNNTGRLLNQPQVIDI